MFSIVFSKLIASLLPWFHRKPKMQAWLESLLKPMEQLYTLFLAFRNEKLFEAKITGQVALLEYMLNYTFYNNGTTRDIYISDFSATNDTFLYNTLEQEDETFIFNAIEVEDDTFLFQNNEGSGDDFIVNVPSSLVFDYDYMFSLVKKYKMAGPSFSIITY